MVAAANTNVVNLEFGEDNMPNWKKTGKKIGKRTYISEERKPLGCQREAQRHRYQELVKDNIDFFQK